MTTIVKVTCFPNEGTPEALSGDPQTGDIVRITTPNGAVLYQRYTEPSQVEPVPVTFDSADWKEYAYSVLGAIAVPAGNEIEQLAAGMRRYGAILKAARASTDEGTIAALDQYDDATNYRKDKVEIFLGFLNADNEIVTDAEFAGIVANWPTRP